MTDRVVLIPGGARGIGRAIALSLAAEGWRIALAYRTSAAAAEETAGAITAAGAQAEAHRCDVSDPHAAEGLVASVATAWGRVDALINTFGPYRRVPLLEETNEGWHGMFDNNLHPVLYLSRAVYPGMKERGWGRIINFSTINAAQLTGQTNVTAYYIAKAGVLVLTRALARLYAPAGITVNAISPGYIDSGSTPTEELERSAPRIPAGYLGAPDDVAAVARFLLSEEARYVNGANIQVSGAWGV